MNQNTKKLLVVGTFVVLGLVVTYIVSAYAIPRAMVTMTKAAPAMIVSISDSYILGAKILAKPDGKDAAKVNIFALDKSGKAVADKNVTLEAEGVTIAPMQAVTDNDGKASFSITSDTEKQVVVTGLIDGIPLSKSLRVTFRN